MKFSIDEMLARLPLPADHKWKDGVWDFEPFQKDGATLVFFAPKGVDYQTHHDKHEFYFIARGGGEIVIGPERFECSAGDAFYVEAFVEHRFENFTEDFATWAIFF